MPSTRRSTRGSRRKSHGKGPEVVDLSTDEPETLNAWEVKAPEAEPEEVKAAARSAAKLCQDNGVDLAQLALQFSCEHTDISSTVAGSANPENIKKWDKWLAEPIDRSLLAQVQAIFAPVKNLGHLEGLHEDN